MGFAKLRLQSYGSLVFGVTSQSPFPLSAIVSKHSAKMKYLLSFFLILSFSSCKTTKLDYSTKKIYQLERKGFKVIYNDKETEFKNYILDENNIKQVSKNRKLKTINIIPKDKTAEFINANELVQKIKSETKQNFDLIIISGIPIIESEIEKIQIEKTEYKDYKILSAEEINSKAIFCKGYENGILVINTK